MTEQGNFKTIARVAVGGGILAAGACALFTAAPAQATWGFGHLPTPNYGALPGQIRQAGFGTPLPPSQTGWVTRNTAIAPAVGSTVTVNGKPVTVPGTPTASIPAVATPGGTQIYI